MGRHLTRWLIPLPAILFAVFPQQANAEPISGLNAVGYSISEIPPTQSDDLYPVCHSELENNINRNFDGEPFGDCPTDLFMVHYTGFITVPENNTIKFMVAADDGGTVKIGTTEFGTWNDKGCSWSAETSDEFAAGSYALDGWFYENGGGTCYMLAWNINDEGWAIVPDEAFTTSEVAVTTTTTPTTTTTTTSTLPETTTSTSLQISSTTSLPTESSTTTTQVQINTTTSVANTTTSLATTTTTTTQAPSTPTQTTSTTDQPVAVPNTSAPVSEPLPEQEAVSTTTETTSETTSPTTTLPDTTPQPIEEETSPQDTSTSIETTTSISQPASESTESTLTNETETTLPLPQTDNSEASNAILEPVISIETTETGEISPEVFDQILDEIADAEPEKVVAIVEAILATNITQAQAVELVVSPVVLEAITEEQAEAIFETIVPEELTAAQAEQMSKVLSEAPTKIKKAFQKVIDIFGSQFEQYVPTGSNIPVSQRRTLVAIGGLLTMLPMPTTRIKQ